MKNLFLLLIISFSIYRATAQVSYVWNGTSSTDWNTNTNWTPNGIPGGADNATIVTGSNNCVLAGNTSLTNLTITSGLLNLNGFTLNTSGLVACNSGTCSTGTFNSTATSLTFAGTTFDANITANVTEVYFNGSTFNGSLMVTKNGASNAQSNGKNVFNGITSITNAGTGYLLMTNGAAGRNETFNAATTLNTTNTGALYVGYTRDVAVNANLTINNTAGTGNIQIGRTGVVSLNTGVSITCGTFAGANLNLYNINQSGATALTLSPGNAGRVNIYGSTINGSLTVNAGVVTAQTSTFAAAVNYNIDGTINNAWSTGGNVYNGVLTVNNSSNGYTGFANGTADTYNDDVYANNTSTSGGRIIFGNNCTSQFNGNIYVSQSGPNTTGGGIALGWGGTFPIINLAATKSIITNGTYNSGYLQLFRIQQADATPITLTTSGTTNVTLNNNIFIGDFTVTAPDINPYGGTYNGAATFNKTGGTSNHNNGNLNIFNSTCTINQTSNSGYFMLGYNSAEQFNDDITVTSTGTGGIRLGHTGGTGTPTLASGKTVLVGGAGFSAGYLLFGSFTQLGTAAINLPFTGSGSLNIENANSPCTFGGAFAATATDIYVRGGTFNGATSFTKTGGTSNNNNGVQNIFNATLEINQQSSTGYFMLGYNSNDLFNDDITVTSTGTGGIYLGYSNGTGSPTLASGKAISVGGAGFSTGFLYFGAFTQLGSVPINLPLTGTSTSLSFRASTFGGDLTATSAALSINGSTFNGTFEVTKTGASNDASTGGNIFNGTTVIENSGSGYLLLGTSNPNVFNSDVTFTNSGSNYIAPSYNSTGNLYNGNITVNSTGSSLGINFSPGGLGTSTLAATKTINTGTFDKGYLLLQRFTQLGGAAVNLNLATGANYLTLGPLTTFGGNLTAVAPSINNINSTTFNGTTDITKNGSTNDQWTGGNTFSSTTTILNSGTGFIRLGVTNPDVFNDDVTFTSSGSSYFEPSYNSAGNLYNGNITVNSIGSSTGINFGTGGLSTSTLAATKTIQIGGLGYTSGYLLLQRFTQLGSAPINLTLPVGSSYLTIGPNSTIGGALTVDAQSINNIRQSTFNGSVSITKNGNTNDAWTGGNTFNSTSSFINNTSGYLILGNGSPDVFDGDVTFTSTGSERILPAYSSADNLFNGNITVNSTGSSTGINFCSGAISTATLAATKTIQIGGSGYTSGYLILQRFTQLGSAAITLNLAASSNYITVGPSTTISGNFTTSAPSINNVISSTFNGTAAFTKNGAGNDSWTGGNTFSSTTTILNSGTGYLRLGATNPDIFDGDVTFTNSGSSYINPSQNSTGNLYNGNINVNSIGSSVGINFGAGASSTSTLAATKTIQVGGSGYTSGYLILQRFTQLGNAAINLPLGLAANYLQFGPSSAIGGNVTSTSPGLLFNGCTFSGTVNSTKTGTTNDQGVGNNTFNGNTTLTNSGSGYLMFGNGNSDQFNAASTFNNTGSNHIYIAYNTGVGTTFGGVATFNNSPTANTGIYVSPYSVGTVFNDNIIVSSTSGLGVQFCSGNTSATATLVASKTISVGGAGFSSGTLLLKQFTQVGNTAQNLTLTGSGNLTFGPTSSFGGDVTSSSPALFFNGCNFDRTVTSTKNGSTTDGSAGGNIFNGVTTITHNGSGQFTLGSTNSDQFNSATTFNNNGSYRFNFANSHNGQTTTFASDLTLNSNKSGGADGWSFFVCEGTNTSINISGNLTINCSGALQSNHRFLQGNGSSATYNGNVTINLSNTNSNTQIQLGTNGNSTYNENIVAANTGGGTGSGVFFNTTSSASSNLASGKTITLGAGGFTGGTLSLIRFTQLGSTAQTLSQTTGTGILISGPTSIFNGDVDFNFPQIYLNGTTYNGFATFQKNGATNNISTGGNIFNGTTSITNTSSNYLRLANNTSDNYNADVTFTQNNSGVLAPNYNTNSTYSGNVTVASSSTYTITFGSGGSGIATFNGGSAQTINKSGSAGIPVFTRFVANKSANGITLNTRINISSSLTLTQGIINTTSTNILNMNNASSTTIGNATSYINGPMNYDMALNGTRTLNFPIGKSADWRPATLDARHNSGTSYTYNAELTNADAQALWYAKPATVDIISQVHWWDINRSVTSTGVTSPTTNVSGNQTITLYYGANDYVTDPSFLTIVKNTSAAPTTWFDIGGTGATAGVGSVTSTSAPSAFTSYSRFTLANKIGGTNPLPIELLYFTANPIDKTVSLDWATASESNNSHFDIERSADGVNFEYVTTVNAYGNGNSVTKQVYKTIDEKPYKGISYYRLKQVDKNTDFKYAEVVSVEFISESFVNVFPNPAFDKIMIKASDNYNTANIKVVNTLGVEVINNAQLYVYNGTIDLSHLASGIYYVVIQNGEKLENIKISVQK
jgi:hypothetical protein